MPDDAIKGIQGRFEASKHCKSHRVTVLKSGWRHCVVCDAMIFVEVPREEQGKDM